MDWLMFIAEMTKALAWPAALTAILLAFRKPITRRLQDVRRFEGWGIKADFEQQVHEIRQQVEQVAQIEERAEIRDQVDAEVVPGLPETVAEQIRRAPREAIDGSWKRVEEVAKDAAKEPGFRFLFLGPSDSGQELAKLYRRLEELREQINRAPYDVQLTERAARDYVETAERVRRLMLARAIRARAQASPKGAKEGTG